MTVNSYRARQVIESIRAGIPNIESIMVLNVDIEARKKWINNILEDLEGYIKQGGSKVRFLIGQYGSGKTHFLGLIRHRAKEMNYAVSFISAEYVRMSRYDELYREIFKNLETRDRKENVFKSIIEDFVKKQKEEIENKDENDEYIDSISEIKSRIKNFTEKLKNTSQNFKAAIRHYMNNFAVMPQDRNWEDENELILRWFHGEKIPLRELRPFHIFANNDEGNAREAIKSLTDIIIAAGYSGIVILVDECERIMSQSPNVAKKAYNNIRHILDSIDGGGEVNHAESCYIILASTPEAIEDKKGYKSYSALYDRIKQGVFGIIPGMEKLINPRAVVINLEHPSAQVKSSDLEELARKVINIHGIAYNWSPSSLISEEKINNLVQKIMNYKEQAPLRTLVRNMVEILDLGQENEGWLREFDPADYIIKIDQQQQPKLWEE